MSAPSNLVQTIRADDAIAVAMQDMAGFNAYLAGSTVAADHYGLPYAWSDIDLFCPTSHTLIAAGQHLIDKGYKLDDRFSRVWVRWLRYGFKSWHTNSLKLVSPGGVETNLIFKTTEGHAATSLAEVIESFDFGLLCRGYETESGQKRDMEDYLFSNIVVPHGYNQRPALPLMPNKRANWRDGFISEYNGLREFGRYAKYHRYGYDLSLVKDDLATGYFEASTYMSNHFDVDKQKRGQIYELIGIKIQDDDIDDLIQTAKQIDFKDSLDSIMEALE
jgi:hypothetical protein